MICPVSGHVLWHLRTEMSYVWIKNHRYLLSQNKLIFVGVVVGDKWN